MHIPMNLDPVDVVYGALPMRRYHCPDLATLDRHIEVLRRQIGPNSNCTAQWKLKMRQDIDRLLDRRLYMTLVSEAEGAEADAA
jgi:hypothetical protein